MSKSAAKCINCGALLSYEEIRAAGPFPCPGCKTLLVAAKYYPVVTLLASLLLAAVVFAALGFRGLRLVTALAFAFLPIMFLAANFFKYLIPPKIEPYATTLRLHD
jgi:hypothetical protein